MATVSRSRYLDIRGLRCHLREWGPRDAPRLFMLHGWLDTSASFQFVVDALKEQWHVVAPDWRGCGHSEWVRGANGYRFADLVADLDTIVEDYAKDEPVTLVGHSMGANVACHYAGIRASRIRRVVSLEGFGPLLRNGDENPAEAPARLSRWLDDLRAVKPFTRFGSEAEVIADLRRLNPRLDDARARHLCATWYERGEDGDFRRLGDPAYKVREPGRYRPGEVDAVWAAVTAPVLHVAATDSALAPSAEQAAQAERFRARLKAFRDFREVKVEEAAT